MPHTPGPWTIDDTQKYYPKSCIRHNGVIVCHLPTMAMTLGAAREEDEANARLIAAAPELLEACENLVRHFVPSRDRMTTEQVATFDHARVAIAKVESP